MYNKDGSDADLKIKVINDEKSREYEFKEGTLASEAIAELGFDFPMPCGGKGRCGKCLCLVNGREVAACKTPLFADSEIVIKADNTSVLTAETAVLGADGAVIDIGTTTVAAALFENGRPVKTLGRRNPQCAYGADVISRIGAVDAEPLTRAIREAVGEIRRYLGADRPTVITGNTAMLALYAGFDVSCMGEYPFEMPSRFDTELDGAYFPPCLSAFVGADALCSLLWSGAADRGETSIVPDLGTNGEIALVHKGEICFTSAAAGPALEGESISRGMAAADGAIFRVYDGGFETIGGGVPRGICGSGIIDAMSIMLKAGVMDSFGAIKKDFEIPGSGIFITQQDVRAYQLCKAAISAAMKILLERKGLSVGDVDNFFLSGALGGNIDIKNAIFTGLLPSAGVNKFTAIGNGALMGGAMLLSEENRKKARRISAMCETVNLAAAADFMERYIAEMNF